MTATRPSAVLVTGSHRSGTTWVGRILSLDDRFAYVHEPFSIVQTPSWAARPIPHQYLYVCDDNEAAYRKTFDRVVALRPPLTRQLPAALRAGRSGTLLGRWVKAARHRRQQRIPLLKDPIALFSTAWLASRFGLTPVVMIRHPLAFAGSLKRLSWTFDFRHWSEQPLLMRDLLAPYADEVRTAAEAPPDLIDQAILQWRVMYGVVDRFRCEHPGWNFVRHEDLSADPVSGFRALYDRLGLDWTDVVADRIAKMTGEDNVKDVPQTDAMTVVRDSRAAIGTWQHRLTDDERERVVAGTADIARRFYGSDEVAGLGDR